VGVESADGNGDAGSQVEPVSPVWGKISKRCVNGVGFIVEAVAELGEFGIEFGEEVRGGQAIPFVVEHGLVSGGAAAGFVLRGIGVAGETSGDVVAHFGPIIRGVEDSGVGAEAMEDLAEEPFGGIGAATLGEVFGMVFLGEFGDLGGFGMGGVVLP